MSPPLLCSICDRGSLPGDEWLVFEGSAVHTACALAVKAETEQAAAVEVEVREFRRGLNVTLAEILEEG